MTYTAYANIGQRDLTCGGAPLDVVKDQAKTALREGSRHVMEQYEHYAADLGAPILGPALRRLAEGHGGPPERLVLTATDQPPEVQPHHNGDTIHCAEILARWLPGQGLCGGVDVWTISVNPNRYDAAMAFFAERLAEEAAPKPGEPRPVLISGGTPAMNMALLYQASARWGEAVTGLALDEKGGAAEYPFAAELLGRERRATALAMLERWQPAALRFVYGGGTAPGRLARLAGAREHLDIEGALTALGELERDRQLETQSIRQLRRELEALRPPNPPREPHLAEAFWQADLFRRRGQLNEMLGRLYLLEDAMREWALRRWGRFRNTGRPMTAQEKMAAIETAARDGLTNPDASQVRDAVKMLGRLRPYRNNTMAGHGFAPVTDDDVREKCGKAPGALLEELRSLLEAKGLGIIPRGIESPWVQISRWLDRMIGESSAVLT